MKKNSFLFALLPMFLFFTACSDERGGTPTPAPGTVPEGYMALEIIVPRQSEAATRALEAFEENEVQTIDILAFNAATDKFVFHEVGTDIADATGALAGNKKIFYVKVPQDGTYTSIYFMVIANAQAEVAAAVASGGSITAASTKNDVMRALTFGASGVWPVKPGAFTRFPMWGLSKEIDLTATMITVDPISLVRSIARIDVGVNFDAAGVAQGLGSTAGKTLFKLEEFYVHNAHNRLMIAPEPGSYRAVAGTPGIPDYSNPAIPPFTVPSIPASAGVNARLDYPVRSYNTAKLEHTNEIYVAEHAAGSVAGRATNFCIVIGARFGSNTAEGTVKTYYRVDFIKTTRDGSGNVLTQDFLPILRNHRYRVNITKVHGRGYDTPQEAFDAMGMNTNLTVEITDQDESLTEFEYDGQYVLGVGKSQFTVDKAAHSNVELVVSTTHEQGWSATVTSGGTWLSITAGTGSQAAAGKSVLKFNTAANTGADRTGTIKIQSGRLFKEITVTQRNIAHIETNEADFYVMDNSVAHSFTIKSMYDWKVKINDPQNILRTFDTSGTANQAGAPFNFKLENNIIYMTIMDASATLTFYSPTGEFADHTVTINGKTCYDLAGLWVYPVDQPASQTWYVYSNTPNGVNENSVPPFSGSQVTPPRPNSCAALQSPDPAKPWRLPTQGELGTSTTGIYKAIIDGSGIAKFGFAGDYYWSASTYTIGIGADKSAWLVHFSNGGPQYAGKELTLYRARCVRNK